MLIRSPLADDRLGWRALWDGYNAFYGANIPGDVTDIVWERIISGTGSVFARFAVDTEGVVGFAHCILHPFTWDTRPACLLHDLYVDPARRGAGVGHQLIDSLREEADRTGWARLYWHTREDNAPARRLYDSYTAADGFVRYTLALGGPGEPAVLTASDDT